MRNAPPTSIQHPRAISFSDAPHVVDADPNITHCLIQCMKGRSKRMRLFQRRLALAKARYGGINMIHKNKNIRVKHTRLIARFVVCFFIQSFPSPNPELRRTAATRKREHSWSPDSLSFRGQNSVRSWINDEAGILLIDCPIHSGHSARGRFSPNVRT